MNILEFLQSILQEDTMAMIEQLYGNLLLDDDISVNDDAQSLMVGVAALCALISFPSIGLPIFIHARPLHHF